MKQSLPGPMDALPTASYEEGTQHTRRARHTTRKTEKHRTQQAWNANPPRFRKQHSLVEPRIGLPHVRVRPEDLFQSIGGGGEFVQQFRFQV